MDAATRQIVRERAGDSCEYCGIPQAATPFISFAVDHVIAQQHRDDEGLENLAFCCDRCNAYKGPNLSSIDPLTGEIVALFHPRQQSWSEHFATNLGEIVGLTPTGRATVRLLNFNAPRRVELRREWLKE